MHFLKNNNFWLKWSHGNQDLPSCWNYWGKKKIKCVKSQVLKTFSWVKEEVLERVKKATVCRVESQRRELWLGRGEGKRRGMEVGGEGGREREGRVEMDRYWSRDLLRTQGLMGLSAHAEAGDIASDLKRSERTTLRAHMGLEILGVPTSQSGKTS